MADLGYVRSLLGGIKDAGDKKILVQVFEHVLGNIRLGVPDHQTRATNLQAYWQQSTSASDTSEFTIAHGLGAAPHFAIPVLDLAQPGAKAGGFEVSRAADSKRVYLKPLAGSTNAPVTFLVE
jgi:hypothetical protein